MNPLRMWHSVVRVIPILIGLLLLPMRAHSSQYDDEVKHLKNRDAAAQEKATKTLLANPEKAEAALIFGLRSEDPEIRIKSIRLLRKLKRKTSENVVSDAIQDKDAMVRQEALIATAHLKKERAAAELERAALYDPSALNRITALRFLSYSAKKDSRKALMKALLDSDKRVRLTAATELGRQGDNSGLKLAQDALTSTDWRERAAAVEAIGTIGNSDANEILGRISTDKKENLRVRYNAIRGLHSIAAKNLSEPEALSYAKKNLDNPDWSSRMWAASFLIRNGTPAAKAILAEASKNPKHPGRQEAARALNKLEAQDPAGE